MPLHDDNAAANSTLLDCDESFDSEEAKEDTKQPHKSLGSSSSSSSSSLSPTHRQNSPLEDQDANQVYRSMLRQELQRPDFTKRYDYLRYRRVLVDWICDLGEELQLRKTTSHTAIAYLEKYLTVEKLPSKSRFQLLALSCILIAAKYLGPEEDVPAYSEFSDLGNIHFSHQEIYQMEIATLSSLQWKLTVLSPIHFVHYYLSRTCIFPKDTLHDKDIVQEAFSYYRKYTEFFVDLCLQEYQFQAYRPSLVAASILATSRKALGISPVWRHELEVLTGYTEKQVEPCFSAIWDHYVTVFGDKAGEKQISPTSVTQL